jgi:hypothetical protein
MCGCDHHRKSKDFADSIGQAGRISNYINDYKESKNEKSDQVFGSELMMYIMNAESKIGHEGNTVDGWDFHEKGSLYVATKRNIKTMQGSCLDILINSNGELKIVKSEKAKAATK